MAAVAVLVLSSTALASAPAPRAASPKAMVADVHRAAEQIQRELRMARAHLGPEAARCVSGKLSMAHAEARIAERHLSGLRAATARGDRRAQAQHRAGLFIAKAHAQDLSWSVVICLSFASTERVVRR